MQRGMAYKLKSRKGKGLQLPARKRLMRNIGAGTMSYLLVMRYMPL